jgi:NhaA family Na+:H+ antiporter
MSQTNLPERPAHVPGEINAPWEAAFEKFLTPFDEFVHRQTTSGLLLMTMAVLALVLANSGWADAYRHVLHLHMAISVGDWSIDKPLSHWVNDGLMTLFFFLVGLELKREILVGELAEPRQAVLPIVAALGGMVVPALIYFGLNPEGDAARGWGIPMATDIAFAIGVLVLLAGRVPKALITFLVALAIVDDLGAVVVIAVFYTDQLVPSALLAGAAILALLVVINRAGIRQPLPYFVLGSLLWMALLESGIHATLAGVLTAFTIPSRPKYDPDLFSHRVKGLMERFDASHIPGQSIMTNDRLRSVVNTLENGIRNVQTPLQQLEHTLHMPVAYLIIPLFALINAGIPVDLSSLGESLTHRVVMGIGFGLVFGKFIGIVGASWLALRLGIGRLPAETRFSQLVGVALLGGIGFTMAMFIADLAFDTQSENLLMAKTGIILASVVSGAGGYLWLRLIATTTDEC